MFVHGGITLQMLSGCVCRTRVKCVSSVRPSLMTSVDLSPTTELRFDPLLSAIFCVCVNFSEMRSLRSPPLSSHDVLLFGNVVHMDG